MNMDNIAPSGVYTLLCGMRSKLPSDVYFDFLGHFDLTEKSIVEHVFGSRHFNHGPTSGKLLNWLHIFSFSWSVVRKEQYRTVHVAADTTWKALFFVIAARLGGARNVIVESHNSNLAGKKIFLQKILHALSRPLLVLLTSQMVSCSSEAASWMWGKRASSYAKHHLLVNGVDIERFSFDANMRRAERKRLNISEDCLVFGHVSNFSFAKNPEYLVDVFQSLYDLDHTVKFVVAGSGASKSNTMDKIAEKPFSRNVIDLGRIDDVERLYNLVDVFVMPSRFEGLPMAALEAAATGLPVYLSENVSRSVVVTSKVRLLALSLGPSTWASIIKEQFMGEDKGKSRKCIADILRGTPTDNLTKVNAYLDLYSYK